MTFGQPNSIVQEASAAPQQCDSPVVGSGVRGQLTQGSIGCDGSCGAGKCQGGCGGGIGQAANGGCNGGCASGRCRCGLRNRLGGRLRGRNVCCPECEESFLPEEYCELEIGAGETEKTCFEVDFKTICIPKIVPPWRDPCAPKCAEARSVKVLKKKKYKCPSCKYSWKVIKPELPAAPGVPVVPGSQAAPANQDYYVPTPANQGGVPAQGASSIVPVQPKPPIVGKYFGKAVQTWQRNRQTPMPSVPLAASNNDLKNQHQHQLMRQRQMMQQQTQMQQAMRRQQTAQRQAITQQSAPPQQAKAGGSLSDYYR